MNQDLLDKMIEAWKTEWRHWDVVADNPGVAHTSCSVLRGGELKFQGNFHEAHETHIKMADRAAMQAAFDLLLAEPDSEEAEKEPKVTVSEVRDDLSTSEDDDDVDVEVYLHRLIAVCRYEILKAQHEETKEALARIEEGVQATLKRYLAELEALVTEAESE